MQKILMLAMFVLVVGFAAHARNVTADMLRTCELQYMASPDNYILRCQKTAEIIAARDDGGIEQFFASDNSGDVYGGFVDKIPDDDDYIYVNVASNVADHRYENQRRKQQESSGKRNVKRPLHHPVGPALKRIIAHL